ncbi:Ni/Fe hydrogenase, type 4, component C [Sulfurimonas gotlandica GD1]|uniref:Ni/Fe hydrogenase, type 4, component C n=1 Tax=Sulfurimonas gotlandica (strain DSM 19862 / JCM 16533 / GD1) TaxID=929558 RepID=B6BMI9_SULGG|nr:NADH-quinone oxidoreductase subunit H [Sulfurimonas gotlandica]EDZ61531.1 membrane-spanning protein of formate hydrogenase, putative [Sulfurimonas gotlandica GD1]EHP30896.1 Ni/Fe hydrogenase, type 4, component C [Sulfurimonas gotlandica GD1]
MIEIILIIFAPLIGGLIYGFERVVRARMQNRQGPPILQPFYDMYKLLGKQAFIVNPYHSILGIMHFVTLWVVVAFVILGENLLYVVFLHLLSSIFIVLTGFSVRSIYSHIGANRELLSIIAYEPILIMLAVGFFMLNGTFDIDAIRSSSSELASMFFLFLAFLLVIPVKLKKSPFDAAEAHQEIVGGVEVEFSGVFFEFLYMAKWLEYVFIYSLLMLFAGNSILLGAVLFVVVFLLVNLVDNSTARVKINHLIKIVLSIGLTLGMLNLIGLSYV